jgi:hypothetical protein
MERVMDEFPRGANQDGLDPSDWKTMGGTNLLDSGSLADEETLRELLENPNTERMTDEKTGIEYLRTGDYWIPNLLPPKPERGTRPIGKYGQMRLSYLENHRKILLASLRFQDRLMEHLADTEEIANQRMGLIMKQLLEKDPPPDKATDQMGWVCHMNMTKALAEEMILDLIHE